MLQSKNAGPFVASIIIAGMLVFFIHEHMVAQWKSGEEPPVVTQSVQEAPAMTANQGKDPFPKEAGNSPEEPAEGQMIDVPYTPPAPDQNQQAQQGQAQSGQQQPAQSPQAKQGQKQAGQPAAKADDGSVQYQDGPAADDGQSAGN